jgi:hypothetical protein
MDLSSGSRRVHRGAHARSLATLGMTNRVHNLSSGSRRVHRGAHASSLAMLGMTIAATTVIPPRPERSEGRSVPTMSII